MTLGGTNMSKEIDNNEIDNEWGISDIEEAGTNSPANEPALEDGATTAFGGQMPVKDVTADLTNVISSQIIVDAVKNSTVAEEYVEDYAVDGELFTEDYINEGLEEALGEYVDEPEYYDDEEYIDEPMDEPEEYLEPEPYIPVSTPKPKAKPSKPKKETVRKDYDNDDDEDDGDGNDKLILIGSILVFILVVILGIVLILKLHGNNKKPVETGNDIVTETNIDDITSTIDVSVDGGSTDNNNPTDEVVPAEPEKTECEKNGHKFKEATCTDPKICEVCGKKEGKALGHDFESADCTNPTTCKRCGKTGTDELGHKFKDATCDAPKTCERCGAVEGEKLAHEFEDATCEKPKTCKLCGFTEGEKADHVFVEESKTATGDGTTITYKCSVCGEKKTESTMTPDQKISKVMTLVNEKRKANNLEPLTTTPELTAAANTRAKEISTQFDHGDYESLLKAIPGVTTYGENIAAGQATPEEVVDSWMASEGHRNNIMNGQFKHMAIGYYESGSGYTYYWVQVFTD